MKRSTRNVLTAAAIAGLLTGAAVPRTFAADKEKEKEKEVKPGKQAEGKKKLPKIQDCGGENDCKGLGGCKTADHDCKGQNDCKGKGGCKITAEDIKNWDKITKGKQKK